MIDYTPLMYKLNLLSDTMQTMNVSYCTKLAVWQILHPCTYHWCASRRHLQDSHAHNEQSPADRFTTIQKIGCSNTEKTIEPVCSVHVAEPITYPVRVVFSRRCRYCLMVEVLNQMMLGITCKLFTICM